MFLEDLSKLAGVSGDEKAVRDYIRGRIEGLADEVRTDALGNLIAVKGEGNEGPRVMLAAHMDEVGLMVVGIGKDGMLRVDTVGGVDERVLVSKHVRVGENGIKGVIGSKPIHLQEPDERKSPIKLKSLYVDIGANDKADAESVVRLGDSVVFATDPSQFGEGLMKGKAFDDRAGCSVLMELAQGDYSFPLYLVFTVQEEVGLRGARVAAHQIGPDMCIAVETTSAGDVLGAPDHRKSTEIGKGPALTFMDRSVIVQEALLERLMDSAREEEIPFQLRRVTAGGTDAGAAFISKDGVPSATVSIPCRYIHSPVSVLSLEDYSNTVKLVRAFLHSIDRKGLPS